MKDAYNTTLDCRPGQRDDDEANVTPLNHELELELSPTSRLRVKCVHNQLGSAHWIFTERSVGRQEAEGIG